MKMNKSSINLNKTSNLEPSNMEVYVVSENVIANLLGHRN